MPTFKLKFDATTPEIELSPELSRVLDVFKYIDPDTIDKSGDVKKALENF
jgi:hypothetical protein